MNDFGFDSRSLRTEVSNPGHQELFLFFPTINSQKSADYLEWAGLV